MKSVSGLLFSCCLAIGFKSMAQQPMSKADKRPYSFLLTTKLHSTGHSIYSGACFNHDPNAEISLSYKYKQIGGFITKNIDVTDMHSFINSTSVGVFRSIRVSESLRLIPYVGYFFRQSYSFMDDKSDMWACVVLRSAVNRGLSIENTILLGNLIRHHSNTSLANRLNAAVLIVKFKLDAYVWYTHSFNNGPHFVSASLAVTSPDWVITRWISAKVQIAILQQISDEKPEDAMHRGGLISIIVPMDLSMNNDR